jgi:magnesium-protoporphyrin O-methyltransferase
MIEPVAERELHEQLCAQRDLALWRPARTHRIARGFYISQALELARP